ncbi:MAG: dolichyl-phosphate beta-glucosyltransferase [Acidobacteriota bacterium]
MPSPALALSVVIPAYNERERLGATLDRVFDYLSTTGKAFEIVVVDDGSSDQTHGIATRYADRGVRALRLSENCGKGAALRHGVLESEGRQVLLCDADLSTPIEDIEKLTPFLDEAPIVLGSRAVDGSRITQRQPFYREAMGKIFNRIVQRVAVAGIADTQCGFKLLDGAVARDLFCRVTTAGFAYDVELVWLARRLGHRVVEVGVCWHNSPSSRVHPLRDPLRMLSEIARFRWHHRALGSRRSATTIDTP